MLLALAGLFACDDDRGPLEPPPPGPPAAVAIVVSTTSPGPRIPPDFLGLGFEMPVMADPRLRDDPVLERLLANLGPGTLRFGGNSVERTIWSPVGRRRTPVFFQLTPGDVDATFDFARRLGWRVTVALNLGLYDPDMAANEAEYVVGHGGAALLGIEIGNEPNLYPTIGVRSARWNVDSFTAEFDAYAAAIEARAPGAPIVGPATWCTGGGTWFAGFLERTRTPLAFTTHHFYPMGVPAPPGSLEDATVPNMLSPALMARTRACVDSAAVPAAARGLALRVDETNSAFGFGKEGVSDVFASALWGLDHLFTLAELGVAGVNIQTGTSVSGGLTCEGVYLPICGVGTGWIARPLYYAMLLFHDAAIGRVVPAEVRADPPEVNVAAHAVLADDGTLRVTIINKEEATPVDARIEAAPIAPGTEAGAQRLLGPSLLARSGVTLGGAPVAGEGTWIPRALEPVPGTDGSFTLSVPAASAALVVIGAGGMLAGVDGHR
jgi:hypothetical protein